MASGCCPDNAWGELKNVDYSPRGQVDELDGMAFYRVGNSSKCIIWNYDIFGLDGGRSKQMCDFMAEHGTNS